MVDKDTLITRAKVAALISDTQLALNVGSGAGVQEGDSVALHEIVPVEDPETYEPLGSVQLMKLRLEVNHVQARLCVARVIDRAPAVGDRVNTLMSPPTLKRVTLSKQAANRTTVWVEVGEQATISRKQPAEEPPF